MKAKQRRFCEEHRECEKLCCQYVMSGSTFVPCPNVVDDPDLRDSCRRCPSYDTTCTKCQESIVPQVQFCSIHMSLQPLADKKKSGRQRRLANNRRQQRQGQGRRHCRSDSDIDSGDEQLVVGDNGQAQLISNNAGDDDANDDAEHIDVLFGQDDGALGDAEAMSEDEIEDEDAVMVDVPDPSWKMMIGRRYTYGQYIICRPCGYILWNARLHRSEGTARVCNKETNVAMLTELLKKDPRDLQQAL